MRLIKKNIFFTTLMNYLIISPSSVPTYCGVGKFSQKLSDILTSSGINTQIIANLNQKLTNPKGNPSRNAIKIDIKPTQIHKLIKQIRDFNPDKINIQYNSIEFGRQIFPSFLPLLFKLTTRSEVQITIHEFANFTTLGKLRFTIASLVADKVFFSDQSNLLSFRKFARIFNKKNLSVMSMGANIITPKTLPEFNPSDFKETLHIGFHGLIQPKNGLEYLLESCLQLKIKQIPFRLHIFGEFKPLVDYGKILEEVVEYQRHLLEIIKNDLAEQTTVYGDIDPTSDEFRTKIQVMELFVVPDIDGITVRRSSVWNVFLQTSVVLLASISPNSDPILQSPFSFEPKNNQGLTSQIISYYSLPKKAKLELYNSQNSVREYFQPENITSKILKQIQNYE